MSRGRRIAGTLMLVLLVGVLLGSTAPSGAAESRACILPVLRNAPGTLTYCVDVRTSFVFEGCDAVFCRVTGSALVQASGPAGGSGRSNLFWDGQEASKFCTWVVNGPASCYATAEGTLEWLKADGCRTWSILAEGHVTPIIPLQLPVEGLVKTQLYDAVRTCPNGQIT